MVRGRLKLNVPGAVMVDILPPLIDRFLTPLSRRPRSSWWLTTGWSISPRPGCDAGIRYGEHLAQDVIAVPIGPRLQQGALCAAPAYLAANGTPPTRAMCLRIAASAPALPAAR